MKKKVFRERRVEELAKELGESFKPVIEKIVESKKFAKPRRVKKGE